MTADELISEGRRLQRPTTLLMEVGAGDVAAIWHGRSRGRTDPDRLWISVNAKCIPQCDISGWLSIFTSRAASGGRVDVSPMVPTAGGVRLYGVAISLLPPIDAVIALGSPAVGEWLAANNWRRDWRYNRNFKDRAIVEKYEAVQWQEHSLYLEGAYATLGGWHRGWPDGDWHDLLDAKLLVQTYMDSEPWVEAWRLPSGEFKVIRRIT
jgi:hypothetical protein